MATLIEADPWTGIDVIKGVLIQSPAQPVNPLLNITFYCANNGGAGFFKGTDTLTHDSVGIDYESTMSGIDSIAGTGIQGNLIIADVLTGIDSIKGTPWVGQPFPIGGISNSFVRWSDKNGHIPMTVELLKDNVAGERPMEFGDVLYQAKKLGSGMAIYGKQGVAIMQPSGLFWGVKTLLNIGIRSKNAITGTEDVHYFLDREGILWELTADGGLKMHDYSNHLSVMDAKTVMSYDERKKLVYICDGTRGFVWSQAGLGKCPINITGMGYRGGTFYVTAPSAIANTAIQIWTDIQDFGSRYDKEIMGIGLGTDVAQDLFGAVAYRFNKASAFSTTPWVKAERGGMVNVTASGVEFKFGMKLDTYAYMRLDYMNIEVQYSELKPIMGAE